VRTGDRAGDFPAPLGAGAATGLVFDLLMCVPALLVLLRRAIDPAFRLRFSVSHILLAALALWAACSSFWASDKFAAAITSSHLVAAAVLVWAMTQMVGSWVRLRLVGAMCFGLMLTYVGNGTLYRLIDVPDNIKYWQEHKGEELRKRGWEPDSFQARQFEHKIINGEMVGFNVSPNTFAAMVVMLGVVCIGVVIQRFVDRDEPGWPIVVLIALAAAAWIVHYTHSKAAMLTPLIACAILGAIALCGGWLARLRQPLYFMGAAAFVLGAVAVGMHGFFRGHLFASSMTFRLHYWLGAAKVVERHPLLGVGWGNFGLHYVGVRLPVAAEEVKDPHNLIVRAFVELGIVGGLLMLAWLARLWWELTAPTSLPLNSPAQRNAYNPAFTMKSIAAISGLGILLSIVASVDFSTPTPDAGWFILLQLMKRGLFLGLLLLGFAAIALRSSRDAELDDRPAPWVMYAMIVAAGVFLLHNLIDFSLFEPGTMGVFAALSGAALGARFGGAASTHPEAPAANTGSRRGAMLGFALAALLWTAALVGVVVPVALAERIARRGDELIRSIQPRTAAAQFRRAFERLWIPNSDYPFRAAAALTRAGAPPADVRALFDTAIAANPMDVRLYRTRAGIELSYPNPDADRIIADFEETIRLDPNDVSAHLEFADALVRLGRKQRAIDEYKAALLFNDLLGPDEPKRLPPAKLEQVMRTLEALQG
jgi:O-Antigen ligase